MSQDQPQFLTKDDPATVTLAPGIFTDENRTFVNVEGVNFVRVTDSQVTVAGDDATTSSEASSPPAT